jgi:hypothetical protein
MDEEWWSGLLQVCSEVVFPKGTLFNYIYFFVYTDMKTCWMVSWLMNNVECLYIFSIYIYVCNGCVAEMCFYA